MHTCPCCSTQLLRHARHTGVYLFCPHCWQEMPDLSEIVHNRHQRVQRLERLIGISTGPVINKTGPIINKKDSMTQATQANSLMNVL